MKSVGFPNQGTLSGWCARRVIGCALVGILGTLVPGAAAQQASSSAEAAKAPIYRPADPLNNSAFDRFYNMDYDRSVQDFQKILDRHPDDPFAVNHLLTAVMFRELYRMGALNTADYANDSFIGTPHHP